VEQVVLPSRKGANLAVALAILAGALLTGSDATAKAPVHHAGVVVQHGDLGTLTDCVAFTKKQIDGIELIELSRFEYRKAPFPEGVGICWLDGEGCKTSKSSECFCTPAFGTTASWSYWVQERADEPMIHHGETYPSGRVIKDGSVDYWTFGPHGTPPASLHSISDICGSNAAVSSSVDKAPVLALTAHRCRRSEVA
jgi:hypothetical protein